MYKVKNLTFKLTTIQWLTLLQMLKQCHEDVWSSLQFMEHLLQEQQSTHSSTHDIFIKVENVLEQLISEKQNRKS